MQASTLLYRPLFANAGRVSMYVCLCSILVGQCELLPASYFLLLFFFLFRWYFDFCIEIRRQFKSPGGAYSPSIYPVVPFNA